MIYKKEEFVVVTKRTHRAMMMNDILVKAFKNGFRWQYVFSALPTDAKAEILGDDHTIAFTHKDILGPGGAWHMDFYTLFFSHAFAQAFFGAEWQQKLCETVLEEDPLGYLYRMLERDKLEKANGVNKKKKRGVSFFLVRLSELN